MQSQPFKYSFIRNAQKYGNVKNPLETWQRKRFSGYCTNKKGGKKQTALIYSGLWKQDKFGVDYRKDLKIYYVRIYMVKK